MHAGKQVLLILSNYGTLIFCVIWTEWLARLGMGAAFDYKKNKSRLKKENKQRPRVYKIFGFYHFSQTHAPHHMKKYAGIRVCNIVSFVFSTAVYLLIPHWPQLKPLFQALVALHAVFLIGPLLYDSIMLSNMKKCGKIPDFDQSRKP